MKKLTNISIKLFRLVGFLAFASASVIEPMDLPAEYIDSIWVEANDGLIVPVEGWQIPEMKTLFVLFEHQRGTNSRNNPLKASMISYDELSLLIDAFKASRELVFDQFFMDLAYRDGLWDATQGKWPQFVYTLGEGKLRMLVNAAARVEAQGISALCGTYYLPEEMQRSIVAQMIDPIIDFIKGQIISRADENALTFKLERRNAYLLSSVLSPDGTKIYLGLSNGILEVWEVSGYGKQPLQTFDNLGLSCVYAIALNADGKTCAALGVSNLTQNIEIVIFTALGEVVKRHPTGIQDIWKGSSSLAFNPIDDNQVVFSYRGALANHTIMPQFLDIPSGTVTPLLGYDSYSYELSFSSDGSMILAQSRKDIPVWDGVSGNLIMRIDPSRFSECSNVMFYGNNKKIMISGIAQGQRCVEIGEIDSENHYVMKNVFFCDHLFKMQKGALLSKFLAKSNSDGTKIALHSQHWRQGEGNDRALVICNNDFSAPLYEHYSYGSGDITQFMWSKNNKWLAVCRDSWPEGIMILPMISDQEELLLHDLFDLNLAQIRLLYQLYCMRLRGARVGFDDVQDNAIFMSIPFEVRLFLAKYLFNKLPNAKCIGNECTIL